MREKTKIEDLDYVRAAQMACIPCHRQGKTLVNSYWLVIDLRKDDYVEPMCLCCFTNWLKEMEKGEHGLFKFYQTIFISRTVGQLWDLDPHNKHKKKNIESFK